MNDTEQKLAAELLKDITANNASQRLEDYKLLLDCVQKRIGIEQMEKFPNGMTATGVASASSSTATGIAAIDDAQ